MPCIARYPPSFILPGEDFFILLKILSKKIHRLLKIKILNRSEKNIDQIIEDHKDEKGWGKSTIYRRVAKLKKQGVI